MRELFPLSAIVRDARDLKAAAAAIRADHERVRKSGQASVEAARDAGEKLDREQGPLKKEHAWVPWLRDEVQIPRRTATDYLIIYRNRDKWATVAHLGVRGVLEYLRREHSVDAEDEDEDEEEEATEAPDERGAPLAGFITLDDWNKMGQRAQAKALATEGRQTFNAQGKNKNIEWALWSWNPVSGCLHNCPYCYARDIAERFYPQKFAPSLWPDRLKAPQNTSFPEAKAKDWMGHKNVFTCSMADLFGRWVPAEWIEAVLAEVKAAPQWNFLFLTKFPQRLSEFEFPPNAWLGTTVDCQARIANAERAFRKIKGGFKWLSCEPLIEPLKFTDLGMFDWIVLGGASKSSQTPEWRVPFDWVVDIHNVARRSNVKVYHKSNLLGDRVREYPGVDTPTPTEAPGELRYLPTDKGK